jgi:hypothetical protein
MSTSKRIVLSNVILALGSEQSLERSGRVIAYIASQLAYAGVAVTADELRVALDEQCEADEMVQRAVGGGPRVIELREGPWGSEYRIRLAPEALRAWRACIEAIYAVTDTLDRSGTDSVRPRAFAIAVGHLRVRWARGQLSAPKPAVIRGWFEGRV